MPVATSTQLSRHVWTAPRRLALPPRRRRPLPWKDIAPWVVLGLILLASAWGGR